MGPTLLIATVVLGSYVQPWHLDGLWPRAAATDALLALVPGPLRTGNGAPPPITAKVMIGQPPQVANLPGGLPTLAAYRTKPLVDQPWVAAWTTRPNPTYPQGPSGPAQYPTLPTALLISTRHVAPVALPGALGGHLMVGIGDPRDDVLVPNQGGMLTQSGGTVHLSLTWPEEMLGVKFYMQLLVADDRCPAGVAMSPLLQLVVGNS